jgi:predicted permease
MGGRLFRSARRRRALDDLDEDIRDHIARETQDNIDRGMAPDEARRQAMLAFGNVALAKEDTRRVWVWAWLEEARQDLRYAARTLRRNRAFATAAAATLALAIATTTAMFSVVNAVLLRPLPYRAPQQLALLWTEDPTQNIREGRSSQWDVDEWRSRSQSFADMATFDAVSMTLTEPDGAEQIVGASMSPNLLSLLGVQPVRGRTLSREEAGQRQRLVLISHRFWHARFAGSDDAIGATLVIDGRPARIIGVLPAGFQIARLAADVWEPHTSSADPETGTSAGVEATWFVVARLGPNVTFDQAQAEMSAIAGRLNDRLPAADRNRGISIVPLGLHMVGAQSRMALWMLSGAVFCVFLIAAANVASLSLARGIGRAREMAVRAALGASAGRIARQLLTESVLLAGVSGLIGTLLALAGIRLIRTFGPANLPRLNEVSLDLRALGCAVAISLLAGILVALAPVATALRRDLRLSGEEGGRTVSGGSATRRVRRALVVAEFALAIVVLVGAGLLIRSWWHVESIDAGFKPERVLVIELSTPTTFKVPTQRADLYQRVLEETGAVPGVESAGIIGDLFIGNTREQVLTTEGDGTTVSERLRLRRDEVSADFFKTIGTPLLQGRFFSIADGPDAPPVAIINEAMARRLWPGRDPLGRRLKLGAPESERAWYTVVGVVADMRRQGLEREPVSQMFEPLAQNPPRSVDLFIRTSTNDPTVMAGSLRAAVRRVEKDAPIYGVAPLEVQLGTYLTQRRFQTSLLTGFSIVALLMAAVGIYGLIHYSIATRTQEIGLRMAVGARAGDIFRMIIKEGLTLSFTGLGLGLVGAWWLGRASSSLLFGVTGTDPVTFVTVSLLLIAVAAAACYFPARRAMTVDPIVALRVS